ncbi:hypothetical protein K4A76_14640 [Pseudomonas sp. NEEL19]|uniref:hypothetical protein n=1 Tax=Pseudomonas sp. NEEL19 TaxID=2867409 RepID=UPI0023684B4F|nr:hypothetical protein [Pseudomonas sp. NEEL19]WDM57711.1 hypothetical protein K4A76_14640 [Pseudomonas sp. NEEL19]
MLQWITRRFRRARQYLPSNHFQDIPGSYEPTIDDLRAEAINFDQYVKAYIERATGKKPKESLGDLIRHVLKDHPQFPEHPEIWSKFLAEARELKDYRNSIIHADTKGLPSLPELYVRFKEANAFLRPFRVCSARRDRFTQFRWKIDFLNFKIDEQPFSLSHQDIENLLAELHPSSRSRVYFKAGKQVHSAMLDVENIARTYFIEGYEPFKLSDEEAMALDDLLICFLGNPGLRMP